MNDLTHKAMLEGCENRIKDAIAQARREAMDEDAKTAQGKMILNPLNDRTHAWNMACMTIHDAIRARAAQEESK